MDYEVGRDSHDQERALINHPPTLKPAAHLAEKRTAGLMVYMTPTQRSAFKQWAFDRDQSMSEAVCAMVAEHMASAPPSPAKVRPHEPEPDAGSGLPEMVVALADRLWLELEQGTPLPVLASQVGLSIEQATLLMRRSRGRRAETGA